MNFLDELTFSYLEHKINNSYAKRLKKYGNTPQGLFWRNSFTQIHRYELIFTAINKYYDLKNFTICDVGCGHGKFLEFLKKRMNNSVFHYQGCDLNFKLINYCKKKFSNKNCTFFQKSSPKGFVDFSVMSGTFNLCVTHDIYIWEKYLLKNLTNIWRYTNKVMIFNLLHKNERKIDKGLYYSNKNWIKNICEKRFGKTEVFLSSILPNDILIMVKT